MQLSLPRHLIFGSKKKANIYNHPLINTVTAARIKAICIQLNHIADLYLGNANEPE
jgi:hypothetical protein